MKTVIRSLVMMALLFVLAGCDYGPKQLTVKLVNQSDEATHLWVDEETIGPDNKVLPGYERIIVRKYQSELDEDGGIIESPEVDVTITVFAGRNGSTITYHEFNATAPGTLTVYFNGTTLSR